MTDKRNTTKDLSFAASFEELSARKQTALRNQLSEECGWRSRTTFWNRLTGFRPVRKTEIRIIEEAFRTYGMDAWTGKRLN